MDVLDVRLPHALRAARRAERRRFETRRSTAAAATRPHRPRRPDRAADRRRARLAAHARPPARATSRPTPRSRAASRCTRTAGPTTSRSGSTAATCPRATAGASPRTTSCGSASARSTRASTSRTRPSSWPRTSAATPVRYQGNWIPHQLRDGTEDGIFFCGDSAGHCLPLTAEGIRTALLLLDRLRARAARASSRGAQTKETALRRYHAFCAAPRMAVPLDAARPARGAARAAAAARPGDPRDGNAGVRRLVLQPLPQHRPPVVRAGETHAPAPERELATAA